MASVDSPAPTCFAPPVQYDLIVVGAGPAGAMCARIASERGVRTLLLDRAPFPRMKCCAGGIPHKTIAEAGGDLDEVLEVHVTRAEVALRSADRVTFDVPGIVGEMVMRDRFDALLVDRARQAGAVFRDGVRVRGVEVGDGGVIVSTRDERYRGQLVVGADGARGIVARSQDLMPNLQLATAIEAEVRVPDRDLQRQGARLTLSFGSAPHGYGWIFPKRDHLSVGLFCGRPPAPGLRRMLQDFCNAEPRLQNRTEITYQRGHPIPLGGDRSPLHGPRVLLAGDAAGLADPFLGEGLYYALRSGRLAGESTAAFLGGEKGALASYTLRVQREIVDDLKWARFFSATVHDRPQRYYPAISRSPLAKALFGRAVRGDLSFRSCVLLSLAAAPLAPWWRRS